jgi:S-adenosylmethionine uptake transporter
VFSEPIALYTLAGAGLIITGCLVAAQRRSVDNVEAAV